MSSPQELRCSGVVVVAAALAVVASPGCYAAHERECEGVPVADQCMGQPPGADVPFESDSSVFPTGTIHWATEAPCIRMLVEPERAALAPALQAAVDQIEALGCVHLCFEPVQITAIDPSDRARSIHLVQACTEEPPISARVACEVLIERCAGDVQYAEILPLEEPGDPAEILRNLLVALGLEVGAVYREGGLTPPIARSLCAMYSSPSFCGD